MCWRSEQTDGSIGLLLPQHHLSQDLATERRAPGSVPARCTRTAALVLAHVCCAVATFTLPSSRRCGRRAEGCGQVRCPPALPPYLRRETGAFSFYLFPRFAVIVKSNGNKNRPTRGGSTGALPGFRLQERVVLGVASSFMVPLDLALWCYRTSAS